MNTNLNTLISQLARLNAGILDYAIVLAAVGTIVMAFIELIKSVFDLRLEFHRWRVRKWIEDSSARTELLLVASGGIANPAERPTERTSSIGEVSLGDAIYDQSTEKMLGQIQAATNLVMDFPHLYPHAYAFIARPITNHGTSDDGQLWLAAAQRAAAGEPLADNDARTATQARARIGNLVARRLDGFQSATQYLWAEINQRASFVLGSALILAMIWPHGIFSMREAFNAMLLAVFGGLVAPFAKDVVSALSGLKVRRG